MLVTQEVAADDGVVSFVKIDKCQEWLFKAAAGKGARPGALARVNILDVMKQKLISAVAAPADSQGSADADADPMAALAPLVSTPKKRTREPKRGKDNITTITMPAFDRSAHPGDERTRVVHLLASSTTTLWLAERDIEWLVACVTDEYHTGGVPLDEPAAAGQAADGELQGARREHQVGLRRGFFGCHRPSGRTKGPISQVQGRDTQPRKMDCRRHGA